MKKILITGGTGSGKTYTAFKIAREVGTFAYFSPTKLLAYESFIEYGLDDSRINTSSVKLGAETAKNYFGCYASVGQWDIIPSIAQDEINALDKKAKDLKIKIEELDEAQKYAHYNKGLVPPTYACKILPDHFHGQIKANGGARQSLMGWWIIEHEHLLTDSQRKWLRKYHNWSEDSLYEIEHLLISTSCDVKEETKKLNKGNIKAPFDTVIIDEAHWAANNDNHSYWIKRMVSEHEGNVILVTAEQINAPAGFEVITLKSNQKIQGFVHAHLDPVYDNDNDDEDYDNDDDDEDYDNDDEDIIIDYNQKYQWSSWINAIAGSNASLAICSSIGTSKWLSKKLEDDGIEHHLVHRDMQESCIIDSFFDFKNRGGVLIATNMAQQGINLPCDNLFLSLNGYDNKTSISQKIGRVARRGYTIKKTQNKVFIDVDADYKWYSEHVFELVRNIQGREILDAKNILKSSMGVDWEPHDYDTDDEPPHDPACEDAAAALFEYLSKRKELAA